MSRHQNMLDSVAIVASFACMLSGAGILYVGGSKPDPNQYLTVLGGATLVSLGLVTLALALKSTWVSRQNYKKWRNGE